MTYLNKYELIVFAADKTLELQKKYPNFSNKIALLSNNDPSPNKKYLEYAVKILFSGKALEQEIIDVINLFHKYQPKLEKKDINQYPNFTELRDLLFSIKNSGHKTTKEKKEIKYSGAEKKYEDEQLLLLRIKDKGAACFYGSSTKWCITMKNETYFEDYDSNNVIFYFILRKDLDQDNNHYKIAVAVQRDENNQILEVQYFDAQDNIIDESLVENDIKNWDKIINIIMNESVTIEKNIMFSIKGEDIQNVPIEKIKKIIEDSDIYNDSALRYISYNKFTPVEILKLIFNKIIASDEYYNIAKSIIDNIARHPNIDEELANKIYKCKNFDLQLVSNNSTPKSILISIINDPRMIIDYTNKLQNIMYNKNVDNEVLSIIFEKFKNIDDFSFIAGKLLLNKNIKYDLIDKIFNNIPNVISNFSRSFNSYPYKINDEVIEYVIRKICNNEFKKNEYIYDIVVTIIKNYSLNQNLYNLLFDYFKDDGIHELLEINKEKFGLKKENKEHMINSLIKDAKKKSEKLSLTQVKKLPYKTFNRMIKKLRSCLKEDEVVKKMFKEYNVDIEEIDYIPMRFGKLDVSAKTDHAVIIFNYKLLCDGDFLKDYSYGVHEITHYLQQTTGNKPTQSADDGDYLSNTFEQEGFSNQVEYIANHEGKEEAEEYVDNLLEHHEITNENKKDELESIFLEKVEAKYINHYNNKTFKNAILS